MPCTEVNRCVLHSCAHLMKWALLKILQIQSSAWVESKYVVYPSVLEPIHVLRLCVEDLTASPCTNCKTGRDKLIGKVTRFECPLI